MNTQARTRGYQPMPRVRDDRFFSLLTAGLIWLVVGLLKITTDFNPPEDVVAAFAPNPVGRAIWLFVLFMGVIIPLSRFPVTLRLLREVNFFLLFLIGLAVASFVWSIDPAAQLARVGRLLTMFSVALAGTVAAWHPRRFQQVLLPPVTAILLGSLIFGVVRPDLGIHQETATELLHSWRGLTIHKNSLGALASIGCVLWLHTWLAKEAKPFRALMGWSISAACLILSRSQTALVGAVVTSLFLLFLMKAPRSMRRILPYLVATLTAVTLVYAVAILRIVPGLEYLLTPITTITGKELTFTGRTDIWALVVAHIHLRPWLGSGYGAYWVGPFPGVESYIVIEVLKGYYPGSGHNGYLDVLNDLGIVGLVSLGGFLIVYVRQSMQLYGIDRTQGALFLSLFLHQAIVNLTESEWLTPLSLDFFLMVFATMCLARTLLNARLALQSGAKGSNAGPIPRDRSFVRRPFGAKPLS